MRRTRAPRQVGWTGLIFAAENGHGAVVRLLLERGAAVDRASQVSVECTQTPTRCVSSPGLGKGIAGGPDAKARGGSTPEIRAVMLSIRPI